jgi:TRAP transporter TAXI family solute receptor
MPRNVIFATLLLALVGLAIWVANPLLESHLVFSTGAANGAYYQVAAQYQPIFADQGFQLELLPGAGSAETMERLKRGEVDAGFVQGGVDIPDGDDGLTSLGSLFYEVVWLFKREGVEIEYLTDLQGGQVGIGAEGSGTRVLALTLLIDSGVNGNNTTFISAPGDETRAALMEGSLDAAFFVVAPGAPMVRDLFATPGVELATLRLAPAYSARIPYLTTVTLPEGLVDVPNRYPRQDTTVLAVTANLVVRRGLHPDRVGMLLQAAHTIHAEKGLLERVAEFPSAAYNNLPINDLASRYLTDGPGWFAQTFPARLAGPIERLIGIALPLFVLWTIYQTLGPVYDFLIAVQVRRWYSQIVRIDRNMSSLSEADARACLEQTRAIQDRLTNTRLPFLYLSDLYQTREHIEGVIDRLERRLQQLNAAP